MEEKNNPYMTYESEDSIVHSEIKSEDGDIKNFSISDVCEYPYLMLRSKAKIPRYRIAVLKDALEKPKYGETKVPDGYLNVYINILEENGWTASYLGLLNRENLRTILSGDLFKDFEKAIQMDEETRLKGNMMYTVCSFPNY